MQILLLMMTSYVIYWVVSYLGCTLGLHRHLSHRGNAHPFLLYCGILCGGRDPIAWAGVHRMHHAYSGTDKDPYGNGWDSLKPVENLPTRFVRDLCRLSHVRWMSRHRRLLWISGILFLGPFWVTLQIYSWISFGLFNYLAHVNGQPVNRWWLNLIAPMEGNHNDHHVQPVR